ncbi:MAG TPA: hypothetical protein VJH95_02025 [Candidatus Nanoarchaeia archaeon]|nr:hypothetical protein [Candidatus Nanoarchaeia archaeon]
MNKKGAELSFSVIIIVIILVVVLVAVSLFFTGSFTKLKEMLWGVSPNNLENAAKLCDSNCVVAQSYGDADLKATSSYCSSTYSLDADEDGKIDKEGDEVKKYRCWMFPIERDCPGVRQNCKE